MPDSPLWTVAGHALAIGAVAGMRAMLPLALLAWFAQPPLGWLSTWVARAITALLALGELVADKLPITPSRLQAGPLGARLVIGATCAGLLCDRAGQPVLLGIVLGALSAAGGAVAGNRLRALLVRRTGWPDPVFAVGEDALALAIGIWAVS